MKKHHIRQAIALAIAIISVSANSSRATVSFSLNAIVSSNSLVNPFGLANGQRGIFINNDAANSWAKFSGAGTIGAGLSLFANATYSPIVGNVQSSDPYTVMGSNNVAGSTTFALSGGITGLSLTTGMNAGDQYAVIIFSSSTTTTIAGDSFKIYRFSDWLMPADGANVQYAASPGAGQYQSLVTVANSTPLVTGSVVPEPSTYALLAMSGVGLAGYVIRRRRRA